VERRTQGYLLRNVPRRLADGTQARSNLPIGSDGRKKITERKNSKRKEAGEGEKKYKRRRKRIQGGHLLLERLFVDKGLRGGKGP